MGVHTGDCNILQHGEQVVARNIIARKLPEPCHCHAEHELVSSGPGFEEDANVKERSQRGYAQCFKRFRDFFQFQVADRVIGIAICVVVCDNRSSFVNTTLADEPVRPLALEARAVRLWKLTSGVIQGRTRSQDIQL